MVRNTYSSTNEIEVIVMNISELRQLIREEIKEAKNDRSPTAAFVKDALSIDKDLEQLNKWWSVNKERLKKSLKKNPDSWAYLGDGAELRDFANHMKEMVSDYTKQKLGE